MSRRVAPLLTRRFLVVWASSLAYFMAVGTTWPVIPVFVEEELAGGPIAVGISICAAGLAAAVDVSTGGIETPPFAGTLTLHANSSLELGWVNPVNAGDSIPATSPSQIVLNDGARLIMDTQRFTQYGMPVV